MQSTNAGLGIIVAGLIVLAIYKSQWLKLRLPLLLLSMLMITVSLVRPAQFTDVFVAMIDEGEYCGIFAAFFLLTLLTFVLAYVQMGTTRLSRLDVFVCVLPSAVLAFYVALSLPRSVFLAAPAVMSGCAIALYLALNPHPIEAKQKRKLLMALAMFYGLILSIVIVSPVHAPIYVGSPVLFVLGIVLISLLLVAALQFPRVALCYLCGWLAVGAFAKQYSDIPVGPPHEGRTIGAAMQVWLRERAAVIDRYQKANRPFPLVVMSAEGGGIYAAAHSLLGYRALTNYCPQSKLHTFAMVGVSGGGIGFMTERAMSSGTDISTFKSCDSSRPLPDIPRVIIGDLLSPILANLLIRQPLAWLSPLQNVLPDGGDALAGALSHYLGQSGGRLSSRPQDASLLFVSTKARSGSRVVFSEINFGDTRDIQTFATGDFESAQMNEVRSKALVHSAVASARFPFLTQSALLRLPAPLPETVLVDGGYADNTGALTASSLIAALKSVRQIPWGQRGCVHLEIVFASKFDEGKVWDDCQVRLFLAHVAFAAESAENERQSQPTLLDPLFALLGAREREAQRAMIGLEELQRGPSFVVTSHVNNGFYPHLIAQVELALPLGWRLSRSRAIDLYSDIVPLQACPVEKDPNGRRFGAPRVGGNPSAQKNNGTDRSPFRNDILRRTGCSMRVFMHLFDFDTKDGMSIEAFN